MRWIHLPRAWTDPFIQSKQLKSDMRFGTCNIRNLYKPGSLTTVARELVRYKLDLVGVQEVRWDKGVTARTGDCISFYRKGNENQSFGNRHFLHHRMVSAVKKEEFVRDRTSHIVLRGCWCNEPSEEKSDDSKDHFYEELGQVFDHFPKHHRNILLGDFTAKLGSGDILKPTIANDRLHLDSNDNDVRIENSVTQKNIFR